MFLFFRCRPFISFSLHPISSLSTSDMKKKLQYHSEKHLDLINRMPDVYKYCVVIAVSEIQTVLFILHRLV